MSFIKTTNMRSNLFNSKVLAMLIVISFTAGGCFKDKLTRTYTILTPVYDTKANVIANIKSNIPATVKQPGKIYLYGKYIFLNEIDKGVHIIDNGNPSNPVNVAFINIPGNLDIAVKGNTLYADFYEDLLAIDISDPLQAKVKKMLTNIFPDRQYTNGFVPDPTLIIVDWLKKDTTVDVDRNGGIFGGWGCPTCAFLMSGTADATSSGGKSNAPGIAGSMSRFAVVNDYMYAVNQSALQTISISTANDPQFVKTENMGWSIETIFPFKDKLFIGSASGMFIYSIANPSVPERQGSFSHARACDPVIADDDYAFVTLRNGNICSGSANQLDIVNVQNVFSPSLVKTYPLTNPHGLAKDGNYLFICDGRDGLKVYDASSVTNIKILKHIPGMVTFDVIAWNKRLLVVTEEGLRQYDYSDIGNIHLLSTISINK
jgi:hypothetical protein